MKGYFLDTNAICDWLDETKPRHSAVSKKAEQAAKTQAIIVTSTVALGEIEYGIAALGEKAKQSLASFRAQVVKQFAQERLLLSVSRSTATIYGDLRARLQRSTLPRIDGRKACVRKSW